MGCGKQFVVFVRVTWYIDENALTSDTEVEQPRQREREREREKERERERGKEKEGQREM